MDYSLLVGIHSINEDERSQLDHIISSNSQKDVPNTTSNSTSQSKPSSSLLMEKEEVSLSASSPSVETSPMSNEIKKSSNHKRSQSKVQTTFPLPPELK